MTLITVPIAGDIVVGEPLRPSAEEVSIPRRLFEADELVYRILFAFEHITPGSYAIAELRGRAATAELVVALLEGNIYVGRWWGKHGSRELVVDPALKPMTDVTILAVINVVIQQP